MLTRVDQDFFSYLISAPKHHFLCKKKVQFVAKYEHRGYIYNGRGLAFI
jgi:hypothetical protein